MGSPLKGLKALQQRAEQEEAARASGDRVKATWLSLKKGDSVKVRFLQELDADSAGYSAKNDLAVLNVEHSNPKNWSRKASCSMEDEGRCYACEKSAAGEPGWKQKSRLYVNVLVDNGKDPEYVAVLSQSFSGQSITPALIEQATEMGSITDRWFKIKRQGEKKDTTYILTPLREVADDAPGVEEFELFDLEKILIDVPYERQALHYHKGEVGVDDADEKVPAMSGASTADEW